MKAKKLLLLFLILLFTLQACSASINNGLVLYFPLDEAEGLTATDQSGFGNDGIITEATWATGKFNSSLSFDGIDDYVTVSDSDSLSNSTITISCWFNTSDFDSAQTLISKHYTEFEIWLEITTGYPKVYYGNGGSYDVALLGESPTINEWNFLAVVINGSHVKIYLNAFSPSTTVQSVALANTAYDLWLGRRSGSALPYGGLLDEVRIYNRALSDSEIEELHAWMPETTLTIEDALVLGVLGFILALAALGLIMLKQK